MDELFPADDVGPPSDDAAAPEGQAADPDETAAGPDLGAARQTQDLLTEHVPLTLLVDLLRPSGQTSDELLATEGLPEDEWWEHPTEGGTDPA